MLGKQKATNVVRQVLGFDYLHEAISALRSHSYSLIINETTDLSTAKQLVVLTTYFDMQSLEYKSFLLDMPEIVDGTAEGICSAVKHVFAELHIPMEKMFGYSSDTTNVMFGQFNSVSQLLMSEYPNIRYVFSLFTISTRGRESLQVLFLQLNSCLLLLSFCLFVRVEFSLLGYSATTQQLLTVEIQLGWSFILTVAGVFVHVNRMVS